MGNKETVKDHYIWLDIYRNIKSSERRHASHRTTIRRLRCVLVSAYQQNNTLVHLAQRRNTALAGEGTLKHRSLFSEPKYLSVSIEMYFSTKCPEVRCGVIPQKSSTWEAEEGVTLRIQSQTGPHWEFNTTLGYTGRPCLKKAEETAPNEMTSRFQSQDPSTGENCFHSYPPTSTLVRWHTSILIHTQ